MVTEKLLRRTATGAAGARVETMGGLRWLGNKHGGFLCDFFLNTFFDKFNDMNGFSMGFDGDMEFYGDEWEFMMIQWCFREISWCFREDFMGFHGDL